MESIGTMELLKLAGLIIVGYFILKFIWNIVSGVIKLIIAVILIGVGIYFVKPTILHDVFGKENVENVAKKVGDKGVELVDDAKEVVMEQAKEGTDKAVEKADSLINEQK